MLNVENKDGLSRFLLQSQIPYAQFDIVAQ